MLWFILFHFTSKQWFYQEELVITFDRWVKDRNTETMSFWGLTANIRLRMKTTLLWRRRWSEIVFITYSWPGTGTKFYLILSRQKSSELVLSSKLYIKNLRIRRTNQLTRSHLFNMRAGINIYIYWRPVSHTLLSPLTENRY